MIGLERMRGEHDFLMSEKNASGRGSCRNVKTKYLREVILMTHDFKVGDHGSEQ
jgi:hypothetical protein